MQRLKAILLLSLFTFSLVPPVASDAGEAALPLCCRRAGKHHCVMAARVMAKAAPTAPSAAGPLIGQRQQPCPLFPKQSALPMTASLGLPAPRQLIIAAAPQFGRVFLACEAQGKDAIQRRQGERGPPVPFV